MNSMIIISQARTVRAISSYLKRNISHSLVMGDMMNNEYSLIEQFHNHDNPFTKVRVVDILLWYFTFRPTLQTDASLHVSSPTSTIISIFDTSYYIMAANCTPNEVLLKYEQPERWPRIRQHLPIHWRPYEKSAVQLVQHTIPIIWSWCSKTTKPTTARIES